MIIATGKKAFITVQCEDCGCVRTIRRNTALLAKTEHPCRACSNKRNGKLKRGRPSWNAGKTFVPKKVGSKYINRFGYVMVYCGKTLDARKDKYRLEHRMVAEQMLGRKLDDQELVHHIDGDKTNNVPSNLYVCRDMPHHREIHNRLERIAFELYKRGIIRFDDTLGCYELAASGSDT
jgi:hypothetical protein